MAVVISGLAGLCGLGSLICWIMVLIKMFKDEEAGGVGKGIFGLICGLYALIWGWQNGERLGIKKIVLVWTIIVVVQIVLQVLAGVLAG